MRHGRRLAGVSPPRNGRERIVLSRVGEGGVRAIRNRSHPPPPPSPHKGGGSLAEQGVTGPPSPRGRGVGGRGSERLRRFKGLRGAVGKPLDGKLQKVYFSLRVVSCLKCNRTSGLRPERGRSMNLYCCKQTEEITQYISETTKLHITFRGNTHE